MYSFWLSMLILCGRRMHLRCDKGNPVVRRARKAYGPPLQRRRPGCRRGVFLTNPVDWADSEVKRVEGLIIKEVDALLLCPAESKEAATHQALSRLEPHLERALEAIEIVERVRKLTQEEVNRRGAFMMLLDLSRLSDHG